MAPPVHRGDVWDVSAAGGAASCVVVSPDEINARLSTVLVAPLTERRVAWPFRPGCDFDGTAGAVAIDQIRAVDSARLVKRTGHLSEDDLSALLDALAIFFARD